MFEANTYIFIDRTFQPIDQARGPVPDPDYIEGALELSIDGQPIITRSAHDLIDQLWAYIVNGATDLAARRSFATHFPDQALQLLFTIDEADDHVTVELRHPNFDRPAKARIDRRAFVAEIARAAQPVFERLLELAPSNRDGYEMVLRQIEALRSAA